VGGRWAGVDFKLRGEVVRTLSSSLTLTSNVSRLVIRGVALRYKSKTDVLTKYPGGFASSGTARDVLFVKLGLPSR
jgi:hypothetical protein